MGSVGAVPSNGWVKITCGEVQPKMMPSVIDRQMAYASFGIAVVEVGKMDFLEPIRWVDL